MYIVGLLITTFIGLWIGSKNRDNISIGKQVNHVRNEIDKDTLIECGTWIQDNFSQNVRQGDSGMLPKGTMRMDFTNDHYSMDEIVDSYISRMKPNIK